MKIAFTGLMLALALGAAEDYFPLAQGNEWTYREQRGGVWKIRVGEPSEVGGHTYYALEGYTPEPVLVRWDDRGRLVRWDEPAGTEVLITAFAPGTFESGVGFCREQGDVAVEPGRFIQEGRSLPALEIRYRIQGCADAGVEQELYAANLGLVRRVQQSIAGPVTYDLVRARLGGVSFQAPGTGSVSVTLGQSEFKLPVSGEPLRIAGSIAVDLTGQAPLDLEFRSSQRFDVALASRNGERLWTWSATRLFAAVIAFESWTGSRSFEFELELPPDVALRLGEDVYRVEAWITSAGQRQVLSGAAPMRIGR